MRDSTRFSASHQDEYRIVDDLRDPVDRLFMAHEETPISRPESRVKEVRRKQLRHFTASTARHLRSCKH